MLDTGSSDLYLMTAAQPDSCTDCVITGPLYNASASSTANVSTTPVSIRYLIGETSGVVVQDVVSFGSFSANQTLAATSISHNITTVGAQTGLLGLAWAQTAVTNSTPFVENLWRTGQLDEPLFALSFSSGQDSIATAPNVGSLTIGGTNSSQYTGDIQYFILPATGPSENAILDSGTNSISLPTEVARAFYANIEGSVYSEELQIWGYPCDTEIKVALTINGTSFAVDPSDFNFEGQSLGPLCAGGVQDAGNITEWVVGTPFMQSYYSVFRFDPPSIGLAPIVRAAAPTTNSTGGTGTATATGTAPTGTQTSKSAAKISSETGFLAVTVASLFALASFL
ncbi:hypothetical protein RQP46_008891 [Phenoliferia psychrophenolica]